MAKDRYFETRFLTLQIRKLTFMVHNECHIGISDIIAFVLVMGINFVKGVIEVESRNKTSKLRKPSRSFLFSDCEECLSILPAGVADGV